MGSAVRRTLQAEGATLVDVGAQHLDALVNTIAPNEQSGDLLAVDDGHWQRLLVADLLTPLRTVRAAAAAMPGGGSIVNIVSIDAWTPDPARIGRGVVHAALWNLGKAMSKQFGARGVRVNTVAIGPDTPADDVATVVAFLVSHRSANITGATLTIDRGARQTI